MSHTSKERYVRAMICWPMRVSSARPMTQMMEVSLMVMHHWLTTDGRQMRMAWGRTMRHVVWRDERPRLRAAST